MRSSAQPTVAPATRASLAGMDLSREPSTYTRKPAHKPPIAAAAAELALASATSLATAMGASGLPGRLPVTRPRTYRPTKASARASASSAGIVVTGSSGRLAKVARTASHAPTAHSTNIPASVLGRVNCTSSPPPLPDPPAATAAGPAAAAHLRHRLPPAGQRRGHGQAGTRLGPAQATARVRRRAHGPSGAAGSGPGRC